MHNGKTMVAVVALGALSTLTGFAGFTYRAEAIRFGSALATKLSGGDSSEVRLLDAQAIARARLVPEFFAANLDYPPAAATWLLNKATHVLELYARSSEGPWRFVRAYRLAERGRIEIAEGLYRVAALGSTMEIELTSAQGEANGRFMLGTGRFAVILSRDVAEDLYTLAAATGIANTRMLITPRDFRIEEDALVAARPDETGELYARIKDELAFLQIPAPAPLASVKPAKLKRVTPSATAHDDALPPPTQVEVRVDSVNSLTLQGL